MHWFWRGIIAAGIGTLQALSVAVFPAAYSSAGYQLGDGLDEFLPLKSPLRPFVHNSGHFIVHFLPVILVTLVAYGLLTHYLRPRLPDPETRCRKCQYILRGISEPRCPECGERVPCANTRIDGKYRTRYYYCSCGEWKAKSVSVRTSQPSEGSTT